jgi:hypothetical protein
MSNGKEDVTQERLAAFCQQGQDLMRRVVNCYFPKIDDIFNFTPEFTSGEAGKILSLFLVLNTSEGKLGLIASKSWMLGGEPSTQLDISVLGPNDSRYLEEGKISILKARIMNRTALGDGATDEDLRIRWGD